MLTELRVRNLALIAEAELELGPGLTVLSGETGAGKTALLSSLKLLIGERGDSSLVGTLAGEARVEALFTGVVLPDVSEALSDTSQGEGEAGSAAVEARENASESAAERTTDTPEVRIKTESAECAGTSIDTPSFAADLQEVVVARRITAEGRSRCYVDDTLVTVGTLNKTFGPVVDLYGQHEHQSLLKPAEQLGMLDRFGGAPVAIAHAAYQEKRRVFEEATRVLQELLELSRSSSAEREQAAFALREIEKVNPLQGEYETLEAELPRLQNSEFLKNAATEAVEYVRGEGGALEALGASLQKLETLQDIDASLEQPCKQLEDLVIMLEEVTSDVSRYASHIEHDPEALQLTLDRLGELDGLQRRFGPGMEQVFALAERSRQLLLGTEDTNELISKAELRLEEATAHLRAAATELAKKRAVALEKFEKELNTSIAELALTGAQLAFSVNDLPFEQWRRSGSQSFELLYKPAPNSALQPLAKIASGGELSRVMLAIKGLLQTDEKPMTLVFDEIDAGIGGATAHAVATRLAQLARRHQVIVITHLAQIAAKADQHFLVSKTSTKTKTHTTITALNGADREAEIARMLSGTTDAEALEHARKLLSEASR